MKKILLVFLGMIFVAHFAYAAIYRIYWVDGSGNSYNTVDYNGNWLQTRNYYVPSDLRQYCYFNGSSYIWCNLSGTRFFWNMDRCKAYSDELHTSNSAVAYCSDSNFSYSRAKVLCGSNYEWNSGKAFCAHTLKINKVDKSGTAETKYMYTVLRARDYVYEMNNVNKVYCKGSGSTGTQVKCTEVNENEVTCDKSVCAYPEYWTTAACQNDTNVKAGAATCGNLNSTEYTVYKKQSKYPAYGDDTHTDKWGSVLPTCKKYYTTMNEYGVCNGTYTLKLTDDGGTYETTTEKTTDITQAALRQESAIASTNVTCTSDGKTHTSNPGTGTVTCKCSSGNFWSLENCKKYRANNKSSTYKKECWTGTEHYRACPYSLKDTTDSVSSCDGLTKHSTYCEKTAQ